MGMTSPPKKISIGSHEGDSSKDAGKSMTKNEPEVMLEDVLKTKLRSMPKDIRKGVPRLTRSISKEYEKNVKETCRKSCKAITQDIPIDLSKEVLLGKVGEVQKELTFVPNIKCKDEEEVISRNTLSLVSEDVHRNKKEMIHKKLSKEKPKGYSKVALKHAARVKSKDSPNKVTKKAPKDLSQEVPKITTYFFSKESPKVESINESEILDDHSSTESSNDPPSNLTNVTKCAHQETRETFTKDLFAEIPIECREKNLTKCEYDDLLSELPKRLPNDFGKVATGNRTDPEPQYWHAHEIKGQSKDQAEILLKDNLPNEGTERTPGDLAKIKIENVSKRLCTYESIGQYQLMVKHDTNLESMGSSDPENIFDNKITDMTYRDAAKLDIGQLSENHVTKPKSEDSSTEKVPVEDSERLDHNMTKIIPDFLPENELNDCSKDESKPCKKTDEKRNIQEDLCSDELNDKPINDIRNNLDVLLSEVTKNLPAYGSAHLPENTTDIKSKDVYSSIIDPRESKLVVDIETDSLSKEFVQEVREDCSKYVVHISENVLNNLSKDSSDDLSKYVSKPTAQDEVCHISKNVEENLSDNDCTVVSEIDLKFKYQCSSIDDLKDLSVDVNKSPASLETGVLSYEVSKELNYVCKQVIEHMIEIILKGSPEEETNASAKDVSNATKIESEKLSSEVSEKQVENCCTNKTETKTISKNIFVDKMENPSKSISKPVHKCKAMDSLNPVIKKGSENGSICLYVSGYTGETESKIVTKPNTKGKARDIGTEIRKKAHRHTVKDTIDDNINNLVSSISKSTSKDASKQKNAGVSKGLMEVVSKYVKNEVLEDTSVDKQRETLDKLFKENLKDPSDMLKDTEIPRDFTKELLDMTKNFKNSRNFMGRKPAEVFRTDFITAMKLPETQQLSASEYLTLTDPWRQEWEKGVQVPVNPEKIPKPFARKLKDICINQESSFTLPSKRITFNQKAYIASFDRSTTSCDYDLDDVDMQWLKNIRSLRSLKKKADGIDELTMERAITWFERQCFEKMAHEVATKKGLSIEYDESTTCNVCLSPDAEDGNEIIFCDACNMCAHQHCYGVLDIPEGTWLCNPCSRGNLSPPCCLCPNKGGAMKRMKDSLEWIHVICAWWVPEVKIEDVKYIERITKDKIPNNRWNLTCSICWEKSGACIQCSVKRCVRAYHITCAVKEGLEMKTVVDPEHDDVQHISFCSKHCSPAPPENNPLMNHSGEEVENNRQKELRKLESEFYSLVSVKRASREMKLSREVTRRILSYWTMKRRDNDNAALIPLTLEQQEKLSGKQGVVLLNQQKTLEMERFLLLRQDLERLRNLCYMIVRREKMRKELHRCSQDVFLKQNDILLDQNEDLSGDNLDFIRHRTSRFSRFSEYYQTEKEYEMEHGKKLQLFDDSSDEGEDLLKSDILERVNPEDFDRPLCNSTDGKLTRKSHSVKSTNSKRNGVHSSVGSSESRKCVGVVEKAGFNVDIQNEKGETDDKSIVIKLEENFEHENNLINRTDSERNIFELLVHKTEDHFCSKKNPDSTNRTMESSELLSTRETRTTTPRSIATSEVVRNTDTPTSQLEVMESAFNTFNEFLGDEVFENGFSPLEKKPSMNESISHFELSDRHKLDPLPNNCVLTNSSLIKRRKRRFRNLYPCEGQTRRNSPRLQLTKSDNDSSSTITTEAVNPTNDSLGERISKLITETKRRRLNSTGDDYPSDIKDEPPDYVRMTRSRGSCSHVTGTA